MTKLKWTKEKERVYRAAMRCVDKKGYAYRIDTSTLGRACFINKEAFNKLEDAIAKCKEKK